MWFQVRSTLFCLVLMVNSRILLSKRILFLGTPDVAALTLNTLFKHSLPSLSNSISNVGVDSSSVTTATNAIDSLTSSVTEPSYSIVGVVTMPPAPTGRNKKLTQSPVHQLAIQYNLPVYIPTTAKDENFLSEMTQLAPDLCITAAYGNYLPKAFLSIPKYGVINIHPSLLPLYRGAAPVQRCLENGDFQTGVTLLYSTAKMDAGPILKQIPYKLNGNEKSPELLTTLFTIGSNELVNLLPSIFDNNITSYEQNSELATTAPKLSTNDSYLEFNNYTALQIHNKVRGYSGWPTVWTYLKLNNSEENMLRIKLITTIVLDNTASVNSNTKQDSTNSIQIINNYSKGVDILKVVCKDGSILGIVALQPESKKEMDVRSFLNGLRGATLHY